MHDWKIIEDDRRDMLRQMPPALRAHGAGEPGMSDDEPLFCDLAQEIRRAVEAYDAGWRMHNGTLSISIESLRRWADAMERASVLIEGNPLSSVSSRGASEGR